MLTAMAPSAYELAMTMLDDTVNQARLDGDQRKAMEAMDLARQLARRHPQPEAERYVAALGSAVRRLSIPPVPPDNIWTRRHKRRK
jgi:hypothetical protein